jgi:hypothetical protein
MTATWIASIWALVSIIDMDSPFINRRHWLRQTGAMGAGMAWSALASAAVYLEVEQAQRLLLPQADAFQPRVLNLGETELTSLARHTETQVPRRFAPRVWEALSAGKSVGWVMADRVVGKVDLIDYALGFDRDASIVGLEILAYRESHGGEVRQAAWRGQFKGRKGAASLRFPEEIRNISGATLSCQHLTEGVQRLSVLAGWMKPTA